MIKIITLLALAPALVYGLEALDESQLSSVTGEGLGATFDDVVLYSGDLGQPDDFVVNLFLDEDKYNGDYLRISELRLNKSGETPGDAGSGGQFGTYLDPFFIGLIRDVRESYSSLHDFDGDGSVDSTPQRRFHTALYTGFPAANLRQKERSFYRYANDQLGNTDDPEYEYKGMPQNFFSTLPQHESLSSIGNFFSLASNHESYLSQHESELDKASDKFDLHLRLDSINDDNRDLSSDAQFLAGIDLEGFRLYGTETYIWSHSAKSEVGRPDYGLAIAMTTGLNADKLTINADPSGSASSSLSLEGVDAYLPLGTIDQPLTISTVQYQQQSRGDWRTDGDGKRVTSSLLEASTQLRIEIQQLPREAVQSKSGNIFVRQLSFGDPNDEEIITGYEDIFLRDSSGSVVEGGRLKNIKHRAFVPKTVIYNEQVKIYNDAQTDSSKHIPYIPNENVIELRGLEIQRLVITTQDLNR
ncbi:hypothetical protein [Bacterioplanoides sp.]|uniref:hypothetical protein n=1 Tax=Bacterioplanoides sp. TaxID=2066072 RepID=UPI003B5B00A7